MPLFLMRQHKPTVRLNMIFIRQIDRKHQMISSHLIPYIKAIIKAMNMPVVEIPGYEADDLIGTLAVKAAAEGFECYIVSPDKDLGQVASENIFIHKPPFMGKAC
jgi:5'-3' exonuclease